MDGVGKFWVEAEGIGVIMVDYPPVNALGYPARKALDEGFRRFSSDNAVKAIVLICGGRTFFAGADITEVGKAPKEPNLFDVFDIIEQGRKPVVAAIHGSALGGGYELALVCHYRIAVPSAQVGLPEVNLGLIPGAGGTQRLPRVVGVETALDIITSGAPIAAARAVELGMVDGLAREGHLLEDAVDFARDRLRRGDTLARVRDRNEKLIGHGRDPRFFENYLAEHAEAFRGFKAQTQAVRAVKSAVEWAPDFDAGFARERELFEEVRGSVESAAQKYYFFAERQTVKIAEIGKDTLRLPIAVAAVLGTNETAAEIAEILRAAGIRAISSDFDYSDAVRNSDLIIDATFGDLAVSKRLFSAIEELARPDAILVSSVGDFGAIAASLGEPGRFVGMNFCQPVRESRLVEVVRTRDTSWQTVASVLDLAKKLGRVPVVSAASNGLLAHRILAVRDAQAHRLIRQGVSPRTIAEVLFAFGFPASEMSQTELTQFPRDSDGTAWSFASDDEVLIPQLLYPVVNEAALLLGKGIALRASDIDVAAVLGCHWPVYKGGPLFWADHIGLRELAIRLEEMGIRPCELLAQKAKAGEYLTR